MASSREEGELLESSSSSSEEEEEEEDKTELKFKNDGSFMEMFKKMQETKSATNDVKTVTAATSITTAAASDHKTPVAEEKKKPGLMSIVSYCWPIHRATLHHTLVWCGPIKRVAPFSVGSESSKSFLCSASAVHLANQALHNKSSSLVEIIWKKNWNFNVGDFTQFLDRKKTWGQIASYWPREEAKASWRRRATKGTHTSEL